MNEPQENAALRARYREIQETRAKAKQAAQNADRVTGRRTTSALEDAKAEVENLEARAHNAATARQLTQRRNG